MQRKRNIVIIMTIISLSGYLIAGLMWIFACIRLSFVFVGIGAFSSLIIMILTCMEKSWKKIPNNKEIEEIKIFLDEWEKQNE